MLRESLIDGVWARSVVVGGGKKEIPGPPTEYSKGGAKNGDPGFVVVLEDTRYVFIRLFLVKEGR